MNGYLIQDQEWMAGQDTFIESVSSENRYGVVFEDDGGAFATEFKFGGDQVLTAGFGDHAADFGRTSEAHAAEAFVARDGRAGLFAGAGDDIDDAIGDADFFGEVAQIDRGEGRVFGWFDYHRITGGEGG